MGGRQLCDLTLSNPTVCGFDYGGPAALAPLADPCSLVYAPDARGLLRARQAVADYYADHGASVDPDQIVLTTSTSEGYSFLFRLLCDPGDEVLAAQPSYPLFDFLADLDDVRLAPYPLFYDHGWHIDFAALEQAITGRTRAILLVHPNNPTGHFTAAEERRQMEEICIRHGLVMVVDEVFLDYGIFGGEGSFVGGEHPVLTFTLNGLSKIAGLPQMKAAWIVAQGPEKAVLAEALARLEVIADTFLSMNSPVMNALPHWLESRGSIQRQILERIGVNYRRAVEICAESGMMDVLRMEAGWSLILKVPVRGRDEELALQLVQEQGVVVHPGSFYGMESGGRLVVSLIVPEEQFARGLRQLAGHFA